MPLRNQTHSRARPSSADFWIFRPHFYFQMAGMTVLKQDVRQEPNAPFLSQSDLAPLRLVLGSQGRPNEAVTDLRLARSERSPTARGAWTNWPD